MLGVRTDWVLPIQCNENSIYYTFNFLPTQSPEVFVLETSFDPFDRSFIYLLLQGIVNLSISRRDDYWLCSDFYALGAPSTCQRICTDDEVDMANSVVSCEERGRHIVQIGGLDYHLRCI